MTIRSDHEMKSMQEAGRIVRQALTAMRQAVRPGITTGDLNTVAHGILEANGARSAPNLVYGFPGSALISVNDEIVHGVPGKRVLETGDVVKLDVTVEKDGFMADAACTVAVGTCSPKAAQLIRCARTAFRKAMKLARVGHRVSDLSRAIEAEVRHNGFSVVRELCGHGIGRTIHESPTVPNYFDPTCRDPLREGMVVAVEPIIAAGKGDCFMDRDGWTVRTKDRSLAAHYEQTIVITRGEPILLTA